MPVPNLFIVGSWKAGTSSLYYYLKTHPDIYMSDVKEPHYFVPHSRFRPRICCFEKSYLGLFRKGKGKKIIGEASAYYFSTKESAGLIHAFNKDAKIIIMLRNPTDTLYAFYYECLFLGRETRDFKAAITTPSSPRQIDYIELLRAWPQRIRDYQKLFGPRQVKVILLEDLAKHPRQEYKSVLQFLDVSDDYLPDFTIHNPSKRLPPRALRLFTNSRLAVLLMQILHTFPSWAQWVNNRRKEQVQYEARPKMDDDLRKHITGALSATVDELSLLLGRDLSFWKQ